jgi:transcriptional regulator GlxA family with amidase domain
LASSSVVAATFKSIIFNVRSIRLHRLDDFRAQSKRLSLERRFHAIDRDRFNFAGGTSPLDMMPAVISAEHGLTFPRRISDWFVQTGIRVEDATQQASVAVRYRPLHRAVAKAMESTESHIAHPLDLGQIAVLVGL